MAKPPARKSRRPRASRQSRPPAPASSHTSEQLAEDAGNIGRSGGHHLTPIVGLGGSAGSISAMRDFFRAMPPDSGMAFVIVLHLSTEHESTLASLLQRTTTMPVAQVERHAKVEPNHVYVIPPRKILRSADGFLELDDLGQERGKRVTVDLFFRTLAESHGPHAAAVVLSGADGDGAIGIKRIKECGGLTVAQDPEEAEYAVMPRAGIATGVIDWVLRAADMPARLMEYGMFDSRLKFPPEAGEQPAAKSDNGGEAALRDVLVLLRNRTGRDFTHYKRATLLRRIARRLELNGVEDLPSYLAFLREHAGEPRALVDDVLISVTSFFREPEAFSALEAQVPKLFQAKSSDDTVRVWVPACSTGEEVYSIAMLLFEHASRLDTRPSIQIFATDVHDAVIQTARHGLFSKDIVDGVSDERLRSFFAREQTGYRVRRDIRDLIMFATHDLLKDSPFSRLDLISCRNLLIYLDRSAQDRVLDIFRFSLNTGGLLFLGQSEAIDDGLGFNVLDKKHRIYERRPGPRLGLPIALGPSSLVPALRAPPVLTVPGVGPLGEASRAVAWARPGWSGLHAMLVDWLAPPSMLVNAEHEIVHLSEKAGRYLRFGGGEPSRNLLETIHPMLRLELRAALYQATETKVPVEIPKVPIDLEGTSRAVDIRVIPADDLAEGFSLVTLDAHSSPLARNIELERQPVDDAVSRHLERELRQMQMKLREAAEEHEAATEELKASNEELQAMNEELRSASEELETSREELQSLNEELTTVNQELKAKFDELAQTNSDLHNLMAASAIATVFLDRALRITRFTPSAIALFNLIPTDVGRPLSDLTHRLSYPEMQRDAEDVLEKLVPIEREVQQLGGKWFLARVLPYRTVDDRIGGAVLTFVDITDLKRVTEGARTIEDRYRLLFNGVDQGVAVLEMSVDAGGQADFRCLEVNPAFEVQSGLRGAMGRSMIEVLPGLDPAWMQRFVHVVKSGEHIRFEGYIATLDRSFDVSASRIGGEGSSTIGVMLTDITVRRRAEQALLRAKDDLEDRAVEQTRELSSANERTFEELSKRVKLEEGGPGCSSTSRRPRRTRGAASRAICTIPWVGTSPR